MQFAQQETKPRKESTSRPLHRGFAEYTYIMSPWVGHKWNSLSKRWLSSFFRVWSLFFSVSCWQHADTDSRASLPIGRSCSPNISCTKPTFSRPQLMVNQALQHVFESCWSYNEPPFPTTCDIGRFLGFGALVSFLTCHTLLRTTKVSTLFHPVLFASLLFVCTNCHVLRPLRQFCPCPSICIVGCHHFTLSASPPSLTNSSVLSFPSLTMFCSPVMALFSFLCDALWRTSHPHSTLLLEIVRTIVWYPYTNPILLLWLMRSPSSFVIMFIWCVWVVKDLIRHEKHMVKVHNSVLLIVLCTSNSGWPASSSPLAFWIPSFRLSLSHRICMKTYFLQCRRRA